MKEITLLVKIKGPFFYAGPQTTASLAYMLEPAVLALTVFLHGFKLLLLYGIWGCGFSIYGCDVWILICGYFLERPTEPSRIDAQNPHRWRPGNRPLVMMSGSGEVVADSCGTVTNLAENHTAHTLLKATFDLSWSPNSKTPAKHDKIRHIKEK